MTAEELKQKELISKALDEKLDSIKGQITTEQKGEITDLLDKYNDLTKKHLDVSEKFENHLLNLKNQYSEEAIERSQMAILNDILLQAKEEKASDLHHQMKRKGELSVPYSKTVTISSQGAGVLVTNRTRQGVVGTPFAPFHMSDLLDRGATTNSRDMDYQVEDSFTDGTAIIGEGVAFTESDVVTIPIRDRVQKIGTSMEFSSEVLRNLPYLASYVFPQLLEKLEKFTDSQSLYGNNVNQLRGLFMSATAFAYTTALGAKVQTPNVVDLIIKATLMATNSFYAPTAVLMHPSDYSDITTAKDSTGKYVFDSGMLISDKFMLPILTHPMMNIGNILIGDYNNSAEIITQLSPVVDFSEHVKFKEDKIVARIKKEIGQQVTQPKAFVKITDITAGKTAIAL